MDFLRIGDFSFANQFGSYRYTPLMNFILFVISKNGNYHLLSFIVSSLTFFIVFVLSITYSGNFITNRAVNSLYLLLLIGSVSLIGIVSGIRQNFAWAIMSLVIFIDFFVGLKAKVLVLILYILPVVIHLGSLPIVILRVLFILLNKKR
ncbi:TPA: hypothetical protein ACGOYX_001909, partial [Streptococcus suis]